MATFIVRINGYTSMSFTTKNNEEVFYEAKKGEFDIMNTHL